MPFDDTNWMFADGLPGDLPALQSMSLPIDASNSPYLQYNDVKDPPSRGSMNAGGSSNCHVDLAKITEHETWSVPESPALENGMRKMEPSRSSTPSPPQQRLHISLSMEHIPRSPSTTALTDSDGCKPRGRSRPSSYCEGQSQPKRRMSFSAKRENSLPTKYPDPNAQVEETDKVAKAKPSAKVSHSVIERRYRENLNAKITQLDQTLSSCRESNNKAGDFEADERSTEAPGKTRKADVLSEAMRYVKRAELDSQARNREIDFLRLRVAALEKLVNCGDCALLKQFSDVQIRLPTDF